MLYPAELPGRAVAALRVVLPRHVLLRGLLRSVSTTAHYSPNPARRARGCARLAAALLLSGALGEARAVEAGCGLGLERAGTAVAVRDWFEILLDDGRLVRPSSLAPFRAAGPGPVFAALARRHLEEQLVGRDILLPAGRSTPDRWGRIVAPLHVSRAQGAAPVAVAVGLLDAGLARYAPQAGDSCRAEELAAEARARSAKLGLWAEPYYFVIAAGDVSALESRAGEFVVVEGQVRRIGQTSARFYLDFGRVRGVDFTLTISKQNSKVFDRMGTTVQSLAGKRLRVRGLLDAAFGPRIDVRSPDAIERLER